jgi:hypothetical protein
LLEKGLSRVVLAVATGGEGGIGYCFVIVAIARFRMVVGGVVCVCERERESARARV